MATQRRVLIAHTYITSTGRNNWQLRGVSASQKCRKAQQMLRKGEAIVFLIALTVDIWWISGPKGIVKNKWKLKI